MRVLRVTESELRSGAGLRGGRDKRRYFTATACDMRDDMIRFEYTKPGGRLRALGISGIAEVGRLGADAPNLVFLVNGRVGEGLLYRGEESGCQIAANDGPFRSRWRMVPVCVGSR